MRRRRRRRRNQIVRGEELERLKKRTPGKIPLCFDLSLSLSLYERTNRVYEKKKRRKKGAAAAAAAVVIVVVVVPFVL